MARIMIVDDEPNIRRMVGMALEQRGHRIAEAVDGIDALEQFEDGGSWDLVLLDQRMPGLSGIDVLGQMKALDPRVKVVFMTAYGSVDLALDAMSAGATDFLRKPFPLEVLRGAVDSALQHQPASSPWSEDSPDRHLYRSVTLNGYLLKPLREPVRRRSGEYQQTVAVIAPNGNLTPCVVIFPQGLVEEVRHRNARLGSPAGDRFWQDLAEEMMANYLWRHAQIPIGGLLRRKDYEPYLGPWLDAVAGRYQPA